MKIDELLEAKQPPIPDWAQKEQTEFAAFVKQFDLRLMTRKLEFSKPERWLIGGEIKDVGNDKGISLPVETRLKAFKKAFAQFLLKKAKDHPDRYVTFMDRARHWKRSARYVNSTDHVSQVERAVDDNVDADTYRYPREGLWSVYVLWSISEPK